MPPRPREIIIVGGGIIGCSTAYYLTRHPSYSPDQHRITLLEASSTSRGGRTQDDTPPDPDPDPDPAAATALAAAGNPAHDGIAGGASGKAGGLLALWAFPENIVPLSFRLHDELAREYGGAERWGYRRCKAGEVRCEARRLSSSSPPPPRPSADVGRSSVSRGGLHGDHGGSETPPAAAAAAAARRGCGAPDDLDWIGAAALRAYDGIGTPEDTAQVHPELFTRSMAQLAEDAGVRVVTGARVTAITRSPDGSRVEGVTYEYERGSGGDGEGGAHATTADCVVVAAGPWTRRLLPEIPVGASRAHSVVVRTRRPLSAYALFTDIRPSPAGPGGAPEIYARPDGTAYACGPTDDEAPLPPTSAGVEVDRARCDDILAQVAGISDELGRDGEVVARQACYLPQGGPYIGQVGGQRASSLRPAIHAGGYRTHPGPASSLARSFSTARPRVRGLGTAIPRPCDPSMTWRTGGPAYKGVHELTKSCKTSLGYCVSHGQLACSAVARAW